MRDDADLISQVLGKSDKKNGKDITKSLAVGNYMTAQPRNNQHFVGPVEEEDDSEMDGYESTIANLRKELSDLKKTKDK